MFKITNQNTDNSFNADPKKNILANALVHNINYAHGCTNGFCGKCKALILKGQITYNGERPKGLSAKDEKNGYALLCQCYPKSNITLTADELKPEIKILDITAKITNLQHLNSDVVQIILTTKEKLNFLSGQYIDIKYADFDYRAFSIANRSGTNQLEFHIRLIEDGKFTNFIFNHLKLGDEVDILGPKGSFYLRKDDKDIILVAGGTGLAPVKAIMEELINTQDKRKIYLYWGVRDKVDLYSKLPKQWAELPNITYTPVLSDNLTWQGRSGLVHRTVLADFNDLNNYCVYACGPPPMIEAVATSFKQQGMQQENFFNDSFDFNIISNK